MRRRVRFITLFLLVAVGRVVSTQDAFPLRGTVKDEAGGIVPGAVVTLTAQPPQQPPPQPRQQRQWTTASDANGGYVLENLSPGRYVLSISMPGFATTERSLNVTAGGAPNGDAILRLAIQERVAVVSSIDDLKRVTGMRPTGLLLGPEHMNLLPNDPEMMLAVLRELSATSGRPDQVVVYVDGQPISTRLPPRESIQSIRISTNAYASEFAEPSSGVVEVITRPATSRYQGESQFTFNDSALNERNAFETVEHPTRTQSLSGYLGGPIIRNRWSFLAYAGRWQRDERLIVNSTYVDPVLLVAEPFVASVATPARTASYSFRSDVAPSSRYLLSGELVRNTDSALNQGLQSGLDLPERGINRAGETTAIRLGLVSTFSSRSFGEFRVRGERRRLFDTAISASPAVLVLDTFYAGGNQASLHQDRTTNDVSVTSVFNRTLDHHALRVGVRFDSSSVDEFRRTNQGGTFIFGSVVEPTGTVVATPLDRYLRTLEGVAGYTPSYFSIARGDADILFRDWQASWFLQDDWRPSAHVTISFGLRHDLQQQSRTPWNFAPRGGLAWTPTGDTRHVLRIAGGLFHSRIPADVALDVLRYDGIQVQEYVVDRPGFFPDIPPVLDAIVRSLPTVRVSDDLDAPRTSAVTTSYEWQITTPMFASISYTYRRGEHLLRTLNVNEPDPSTGVRPRPDAGPVLQFASSGRSTTQELSVTLRRSLARISLFGTYTLGSSRSDTDGPYTIAASSTTLPQEFGRAGEDAHHRAVAGASMTVPGDVSVSALLTANSGRPFNITTGRDDNGDLLYVDRPFIGVPGDAGTLETPFGDFDLSPTDGQAMSERNTGRGPSQLVLNVGVAKKFLLVRSSPSAGRVTPYVLVSASVENITNRINYADFNGVITSPLFGTANRALNPRRIQLAASVGF